MLSILLVGIGSRASEDDAVGLVLAEEMARRGLAGVTVELWEDRDPLDVAAGLVEISDRDPEITVVLVDCAELGLAPGCWRAFDLDEAELAERAGGPSVHGVGLADGLALARALGFVNPVRVFGVQPFSVEPGRLSLSLPMATRLPSLGTALADELAVRTRRERPSDGEASPGEGAPAEPGRVSGGGGTATRQGRVG